MPPQFTPHVTWIRLAGEILLLCTTLPTRISSDATKIEIRTSLSPIHNVCSPPTNIGTLVLISLSATAYSPNQQSYPHFQPLPPLIPPLDEPSFSFDRHDAYSSYPPMGSLSISAPSSARVTSPESPDIHSTYRSDTRSLDFGSNDEETSHKGKRRRQQSLDTDDNARKSRNPRKTAVACNFCRGTCIFFITKNYLSALIIAFFQVASYAATAPSLPVTTALSATLSVNMSPSSAAGVQARRQKEADPKRLQLNNHKPRNLLPHGLYPPLLLRLTPSRNTNSNHLPRSYALIPPFFPSITSVTAFIPPAYPQTILHPPTRV